MIARAALLADLKGQVRRLEADLRERSAGETEFATKLKAEWRTAREAKRTSATYATWLDDRVTQAAVAWALATVFVRFCEDNGLIDLPYLAGPGERLAIAVERQQAYFERHPERTDRDWIVVGVNTVGVSHVAADLFNQAHNPMWSITPSHDAAKALLAFWRQRGEDAEIIHDFSDPEWGTRFLGDLYQDLSEYAKKKYALLQTPEFVEEFILDYTLEPAVNEFGLDSLRMIDPTCGSGHFLLGGFQRLLTKWELKAPGTDRWELIGRALGSVHGVDKNPFAANIARFRLLVAAMRAADVSRLADAPEFVINVAIGDSLLHGRGGPGIQAELELGLFDEREAYTYFTEDIHEYERTVDMLGAGSYHVVVGNPPYLTVEDKRENENYRAAYASCHREYALTVPFAERFFKLAIRGGQDTRGSGYIGQITANSFTKREFGKKLVEEFFPTVDLTHVVDTSGVYIPGHGTPTIILIGRRRWPRSGSVVRTARSVNGEPKQPVNPASGLVWTAIVKQIDCVDSTSKWISVGDLSRERYFGRHPWILEDGGLELVEVLDAASVRRLATSSDIGASVVTRENEVFAVGSGTLLRWHIPQKYQHPMQSGEQIRDWGFTEREKALWPYDEESLEPITNSAIMESLWPWRAQLRRRVAFGKTQLQRGLPWTAYSMFFHKRFHGFSIAYSEIGTHFQATMDRDERIFIHSAPVIKLERRHSESEYLGLLGVLNSAAICFWLKQMCYNKGSQGINEGFKSQPWERFYQFNATKIRSLPLAPDLPVALSQELDGLAQRMSAEEASAICAEEVPTRGRLDAARSEQKHLRGRMIALQEELDWNVYQKYGLLTDTEAAELVSDPGSVPELMFGQRAFEIVLARRLSAGQVDTQWFDRHSSVPIMEIPEDWPEPYRKVVERRIETIERRRDIALIERAECKRRWQSEPWAKKERAALRAWLLDRCEDRSLWYVPDESVRTQPQPMTVNRLADRLRVDSDVVSVARLLTGPEADLAQVLADIMADEHVPCLAQLRYKESGLRKRKQWEHVWNLQRQEDRNGPRPDIPVPPRYGSGDFLRTSYWRSRGKLDVPKERFISYPGANPHGDSSLLLGWAGWDHGEQAHALTTLIDERASKDGWDGTQLLPLIAALTEVMPWVRQWHSEEDKEFGSSPAQAYDTYLEDQKLTYGFSDDDLRGWKPPPGDRSRRRAERAAPQDKVAHTSDETGESDEPEDPEGGEPTP